MSSMAQAMNAARRQRPAAERIEALKAEVARLERELSEMVELLHLWKDEAAAYQWLAQAIVNGDYPLSAARRTLERRGVRDAQADGALRPHAPSNASEL